MPTAIRSLADLLAPVRRDTFFQETWQNEPFHLRRGDERFYELLLTSRDVEAAIASGGLRYPAIQLAKGGGFFPVETFTRTIRSGDDLFSGIPNLDRIRAEYQSGATISLPGFHRAWAPLGVLAAAVEEEIDHVVHTNVYITPGGTAGFTPHYDTHEVFVLQIAGTKRWRIHKPPLSLPHRGQPFDPRTQLASAPLLELMLVPGDLLYLPRGYVHSTTTSESASVHVTLGVTVYTWVELLIEWAQSSRAYANLRRALPPGFATREDVRRRLKDELPRIIEELHGLTDYDALLQGFARRVRSARAGMQGEFRTAIMSNGGRSRDREAADTPGAASDAEDHYRT